MESSKRSRGIEFDDEMPTKRFRPDVLLEIIDDDDDDAVDSGVDYLADVMKSLEEEIAPLPSPQPQPEESQVQPDLGYLLEASDDDLGLPPTAGSDTTDGPDVIEILDEDEPEIPGFGWGFEDEISAGYDNFGFGFSEVEELAGFGFGEGGLFDYSDVAGYEPSDYEEFSWRTESRPTA